MRFALLLLLLASPAWGATYWVSPTGTSGASGADSSANAKSLAWFVANAADGDICRFKSGTYSSGITNPGSGTSGARMYYYGFQQDPSAVIVDGISPGSADYVTIKWIHCTGNLDLGNDGAIGDSVQSVRALTTQTGSMDVLGDYCVGDSLNVTFTVTASPPTQPMAIYMQAGSFGSDRVTGNTLSNSTFNVTFNSTAETKVLGISHAQYNTIHNNDFNITVDNNTGYFFGILAYTTYYSTITNNRWTFQMNADPGGTEAVISMRDSSRFNRFVGNTFRVNGSFGQMPFKWSQSGSWSESTRQNYFGYNTLVNNVGDAFVSQNGMRVDTLEYNVIASAAGLAFAEESAGMDFDSCVVRHNTFIGTQAPVVDLSLTTSHGGASSYVANIAYSTVANGATPIVYVPTDGGILDSAGTVFAPGGTASTAFSYNGTTGTPGSGGNYGISGKAVWGSPRFVDSTFAALDLGISQTGYADNVKAPSLHDGFSGAFSDSIGGSTGTSDTSAPDAVGDLAVAGTNQTSLDLEWTSTGDDAGVGTATTYDIRYSTSTITEGNWSSASQFSGEPTPLEADNNTTWTTPTVLSPSTLYYVAMKVRDEVGNESGLSNVASGTTDEGDAIVLGAIEVYPNFNSAGMRLYYSGDANANSTAVMYLAAGGSASTDTLDLAYPPDTLRSEKVFSGSVFWLSENTQYTVNVMVTDADGGSSSASSTFTTRTAIASSPPGTTYHVAAWGAGSDSAAGTSGAPFRTLQKAWSVMVAGDAMMLATGVHRDTLVTAAADSGTAAAPKFILGADGAYLSGADPAYLVTSGWDSVTAAGQKLYVKTGFPTWPRSICFGDSMRLFRHKRANSLATDSLGTAGNLQYGWARSPSGDTLFVQLETGSPNGHAANIASRTHAMTIRSNHVVVDGVGFRHFGTDWRTDYYLNVGVAVGIVTIENAKNVTVRNGFFLNNGWDAVVVDSSTTVPMRDALIERNIFRDTRIAGWGLASSQTMHHHPAVFSGSGRGFVLRYNTYRGFKDGGFRVDESNPHKFSDADIHDNDLQDWTLDSDAIELDYCHCQNVRVWRNLAFRGGNFMDTEIRRGPVYVLYNRGARLSEGVQFRTALADTFTTWGPTHFIHNTLTSTSTGFSGAVAVGSDPMRGATWINNAIVSPYRAYDDATDRFAPSTWSPNWNLLSGGGNLARVFGVNYAIGDSTTFRTNVGWDRNSRIAASAAFADTSVANLTPAASSPAIDRGRLVNGINRSLRADLWSRTAPDMGATEYPDDVWTPGASGASRHRGLGALRRRTRVRLP